MIMEEAGLSLRSQSGVPTFYPPNTLHANTTIDLTWVSASCLDWVVTCLTDVEHQYSRLSDHAAIATTFNFPSNPNPANRTYQNWKCFDTAEFASHIEPNLSSALDTLRRPAAKQTDLDAHATLLTTIVVQAMNHWAPRLPIKP